MPKPDGPQFEGHSFGDLDPTDFMNDDEYDEWLMSFVECDNCGEDTNMNKAVVVHPTNKEREEKSSVTNYYCGPVCRDLHQSSSRKGMIGNPFVQMGLDSSDVNQIFKKGKK